MLLANYKRLYAEPRSTVDIYTRQCSINVTAKDLAVMAGTLANGGVNPVTRQRAIDAAYVPKILAVMATAGLYDASGQWLYAVGAPGKSGVGGGIIAVVPGRFGVAAFSPPLDEAGNSVRAQKAIESVIRAMRANPLQSLVRAARQVTRGRHAGAIASAPREGERALQERASTAHLCHGDAPLGWGSGTTSTSTPWKRAIDGRWSRPAAACARGPARSRACRPG